MREGYTGQVRGQDVGKDPGFLESQRDQNFKRRKGRSIVKSNIYIISFMSIVSIIVRKRVSIVSILVGYKCIWTLSGLTW